jgi:hypothetical protein
LRSLALIPIGTVLVLVAATSGPARLANRVRISDALRNERDEARGRFRQTATTADAIRSSVSATSSNGERVSISAVAPARRSGSKVAKSRKIRSRSASALPKFDRLAVATRSRITSSGALNSATASRRG